MFSHTAQYYDTIYLAMKDYGVEAEKLTAFAHQYCRSAGNRLLDVACGTGLHLSYLKQHFQVEGRDLDEQLLAIARQRNPAVPLHHADMVDFALGRTFDVVTCLFSAIGYVKTLTNLSRAVQCMARDLRRGRIDRARAVYRTTRGLIGASCPRHAWLGVSQDAGSPEVAGYLSSSRQVP
jgi:predicted TPR repeat methyltransferase